ncbi:RNA-directed DNA polymerase, eukaryota [Tanacetum coccineum]
MDHRDLHGPELDDDVLLNAPVVESSKRLALGWINEADVGESSVGKNDNVNVVGSSKSLALGWINEADVGESSLGKNDNVNVDENVHEEQTVNVNDYTIDDRFELDIDENLNLDDYTVYVDENVNDDVEDGEVIGNDREDFIVDEEHVIDDVEVNMEGFTFSVQEQGAEQTVTPNVDLTDEALEVLDFDSFDNDVGDDTVSITRRSLRKLRKTGGQSCGQLLTLVSVDANNGIYPVAYGIVESESKESSTWFLSCLGDDLNLEANLNFTFITDRQKVAITRNCCGSVPLQQLRQLLEVRDNPVITALEYVKEYLMKRIMIVQKVNEGRQNQVVVNLANRSCTCRKWEVSGIPCKHAVACIFNMNDNGMQVGLPKNWVHQLMRLQTWKTVYSFKINPVPGSSLEKVALSVVANVVKRGTTKEVVKGQVLLVVGQQVHLQVNLQGPSNHKGNPKERQHATASACTPKPTRQTKTKNVAANGSHGAKKTPTRQSQRQKATKKTLTTK